MLIDDFRCVQFEVSQEKMSEMSEIAQIGLHLVRSFVDGCEKVNALTQVERLTEKTQKCWFKFIRKVEVIISEKREEKKLKLC